MKTLKIWILIIMVATISCEKEKENGPDTQAEKSDIDSGLPGDYFQDMEIDNNNQFYFVTFRYDNTIWDYAEQTYLRINYLSRKTEETGEIEVLDSNFVHVYKIAFDKNNNLWGINTKGLFLQKNNTFDTIIKLGLNSGIFDQLAVDEENNIWVAGLKTGLYKVDSDLNISRYTTENSVLTTNSITNFHIDKSNNIWVTLFMPNGILKMAGNNWTVYNSTGNLDQYIYSLVTDKNGNFWIGKGWPDESETLVRFNGDVWETINPMNDKGEMVLGTARQLLSDTKRLYVVVESHENNHKQLLTFDGIKWNLISGIPEPTTTYPYVMDLTIDYHRQVLWIRVSGKGIYKLYL